MAGVKENIHETSPTTGTGDFTVSAVDGRVRFSDTTNGFGTGVATNVFNYYITHRTADEYERGTGHMSDANTLVRDTVLSNSLGTTAKINFTAGTKDVTCDLFVFDLTLRTDLVEGHGIKITDAGSGGDIIWQMEPGAVLATFDETPQTGCLELNGSTIVGGVATYPDVAARYTWMQSGANLVLPDLRGEFIRGYSNGRTVDPNRTTRTGRVGDGLGGDRVGTTQGHMFQTHVHRYGITQNIGGGANARNYSGGSTFNTGAPSTGTTGSETRPRNIYMMFQMVMG